MSGDQAGGDFPGPVIDVAIEPKVKADYDKLSLALAHIAMGDASFRVRGDEESGQTILSGMGELHLDMLIERLRAEFGLELNIGAPQIAYRETISKTVEHDYAHKKPLPGAGQFARITFRIEPEPGGGKPVFVSTVPADNIPATFIPAVETGVRSVMAAGPIIGFPMVGLRFILLDGAYHAIDSSAWAIEAAGRNGFREAIEKTGPVVLENPVEPITASPCRGSAGRPQDASATVIAARRSARWRPGIALVVAAMVPLASMFGYVNSLRSITSGVGHYTMAFDHYEVVPPRRPPTTIPLAGLRGCGPEACPLWRGSGSRRVSTKASREVGPRGSTKSS